MPPWGEFQLERQRELPAWPKLLIGITIFSLAFATIDVLLSVNDDFLVAPFLTPIPIAFLIRFSVPFGILVMLFKGLEKEIYGVAKKQPSAE
jgi:hypothetical protein